MPERENPMSPSARSRHDPATKNSGSENTQGRRKTFHTQCYSGIQNV